MHGFNDDDLLEDTIRGLHNGDFSRLEPRLTATGAAEPDIIRWHREGRFQHDSKAVAEALTCACFLGLNNVAEYLLAQGVDPSAGAGTGMDALHWATNRGQLESVRMLLKRKLPLEARNSHGTTVLGTAIWSAINEPKPHHLQIIYELLNAGALISNVRCPTGSEHIDELLGKHAARALTVDHP
jgi:hypothetical protein